MDYTGDAWLDFLHHTVDAATQVQQTATTLLLGLLFAWLVLPFLATRSKRHACFCGIGYFLFYFLYAQATKDIEVPRLVSTLYYIAAGFLLLYGTERRNPRQKMFLSMTYYLFIRMFIIMTGDQNGALTDWMYRVPVLNRSPEATVVLFIIGQVEYLLFFAGAMGVAIFFFQKAYRYKQEELGVRDFAILSVPCVFFQLHILMYLHYYTIYTELFQMLSERGNEEVLSSLSWDSGTRFVEYAVAYLFQLAFVWLFFDLKRQNRQLVAESVRSEQEVQLDGHIRQVERMYSEMQSLRHDMNHHIMVLNGLVERQDWENASAYLLRIGDELSETRPAVVTGHPVTDIILSEKKREAESQGISFDCDFQFPAGRGIDAFDISVLLGNALNNAIAGVLDFSDDVVGGNGNGDSSEIAETPFISVRSFVKDNMYLIEVKNSFYGEWEIDRDSGFPLTAKSGGQHGIGLYNMKSIAQKYHGDISLERKDGVAELTVLVQMGDGNK